MISYNVLIYLTDFFWHFTVMPPVTACVAADSAAQCITSLNHITMLTQSHHVHVTSQDTFTTSLNHSLTHSLPHLTG